METPVCGKTILCGNCDEFNWDREGCAPLKKNKTLPTCGQCPTAQISEHNGRVWCPKEKRNLPMWKKCIVGGKK